MDSQINSITEKLYIPKMIDNIYNTNFLLSRLNKNKRSLDGGTQIAQPVEYDELVSGAAFQGYDLLDTVVNEIASQALFDWRHYFVTLGWSREDYLKNKSSKTKIVNLVSAITQNATKKMQKLLTAAIFGSNSGGNDIDGLGIITAAGTTDCGGLDSNDFSTWAPTRDTTTTVLTLAAMNSLYRTIMDGPDAPTIVVTTDAIMGYYYNISTPLQRYVNTDTAKSGFTTLEFNGIPLYADKACTASTIYMLNEDHLWLAVHKDEDMRYKAAQEPLNQAVSLGQVFWYGNLVTDSRRRQGVMTAIAA